jgi:hypothetical protein
LPSLSNLARFYVTVRTHHSAFAHPIGAVNVAVLLLGFMHVVSSSLWLPTHSSSYIWFPLVALSW